MKLDKKIAARIEEKLGVVKFEAHSASHIEIKSQEPCMKCKLKQCIHCCPAHCYELEEDGRLVVSYEGCMECGTCRIVCNEFRNIDWVYPRGGFGVQWRYG